uniref:16S rRNA (cytosine(967)-C(5))-methyltransferase n=1 Tax=uncultured Thiotrichaceae bacterium TaxID=298394 RepID=A0A6S6UK79_9GAMM|nr:MAG: Ribosomal RNA small subunit methyltransferase B (EC [uncultured Thiotrichaceae bacterium]
MSDRLKAAWPDQWESIMAASNTQAPMVLRVNQRMHQRDEYLALLKEAGFKAIAAEHTESGIVLEQAVPVFDLPGFSEGAVSVQDSAAQLAAELLSCEPGNKVLDACSAPGGKACHLLERYDDLKLIALDSSERRLEQVKENLERLKVSASIVTGDASDPKSWWGGEKFDRILLDAPCSATGVIRRHPDIKILRKEQDIASLQLEQAAILKAVWKMLKPGGLLLYATCSILPEENELQIKAFLQGAGSAELLEFEQKGSQRLSVIGQQILPGDMGMDGFYYALLRKITQE